MRLFPLLIYLMIFLLLFQSCKKEYSFESGAGILSDSSGRCFDAVVHGTYKTGVALTADNYLLLPVNVTRTGHFSIQSDKVNGYSFSATGIFSHTGMDTVKLTGTGTPVQNSQNIFLVNYGSRCSVYAEVIGTPTNGIFSCKIDGEEKIFTLNRGTLTFGATPHILNIFGSKVGEAMLLTIGNPNGPIVKGVYNSLTPGNMSTTCYYAKNINTTSGSTWNGGTGKPIAFTVIINEITLTRVAGSYSGTVLNETGSLEMDIVNGVFDVPIY